MTDDRERRELAVHRLLQRYAAAVDAHDIERIADCFGDDGCFGLRGAEYRGDALREFYRASLSVPTLHFVTGIVIDGFEGGLCTSTCGLFAIEIHDDGWRGVAGRYDDVIRVDGGGNATFVSRHLTMHPRVRLSPE